MIENQIEFNRVKEIWSGLAITSKAKQQIELKWIILDETTLRREIKDTTDAKELIKKLGNPPLQDVSEILEILEIAQKGDCLSPYQLERVEGILTVLDRLSSYLKRGHQYQNDLSFYDESLYTQEELREEIATQIRGERVDDHASKLLLEIRIKIQQLEDEMKKKAESVIYNNRDYMADNFYTTRNGRICVPVKKEYKYRIPGSLVDKSSTGSTLFVEPEGVIKIGEEVQSLRIDEENEVYRILYTLTAMVADCAEALTESIRIIEKLDYVFSKGKLSIELDANEPQINLDRRIVLDEARHPLMDPQICVPLNFELGTNNRGVVITGPNTGGKTVSIKTVMLNAVMAQCGLHVCCKSADLCMNSGYFCDIGDGQDLTDNLSTFSSHIKNVLNILAEIDKDGFVIMDELGSGTDPQEGMGIAIAILEKLRETGANFLVTTHYPEVKEYAAKSDGIVNARMAFDRQTLKPTYQMIIGEAGESCAFYIADRLGMSKEMLKIAVAAAYGEDAVSSFDFQNEERKKATSGPKISRKKAKPKTTNVTDKFQIGDSVMVLPDKKIGIVCEEVNEKGVLRVQVAKRKIWINHKRVKLHVKAQELYPEDYDMSIVFDTVENRKKRHDMGRKYTTEVIEYKENDLSGTEDYLG
ncbi:DNA mismatch repair protein MutS [Butyrivibrio sp. CB08]|jgi:dsDNA-specific endonuclease/ATPase MutS2|uniref:endonuclease MutS2 n=1 Tax=Butyrivibrio sp. CB08 TaxID=2364879 RepID=UPI000EAA6554|nr:DNA mismatch repair protein MutS [Butyrivibrio sp. CB08]RKM61877.1 DNA mismatch repair protein MutS [Butyrivibrio sp. CB08]